MQIQTFQARSSKLHKIGHCLAIFRLFLARKFKYVWNFFRIWTWCIQSSNCRSRIHPKHIKIISPISLEPRLRKLFSARRVSNVSIFGAKIQIFENQNLFHFWHENSNKTFLLIFKHCAAHEWSESHDYFWRENSNISK